MLHGARINVGFDPNHIRQIDEAKKKYIQARHENREIFDLNGNVVSLFPRNDSGFIIGEKILNTTQLAIRTFDGTGDQRLIWNMSDPFQIKEAAKKFKECVEKGWKPYAIKNNGNIGQRVISFDAKKEEILFKDKTTKQRLKDFSSKFKEIKMMPKTWAG